MLAKRAKARLIVLFKECGLFTMSSRQVSLTIIEHEKRGKVACKDACSVSVNTEVKVDFGTVIELTDRFALAFVTLELGVNLIVDSG
jgi:hypothetical protein